MDNEETNSDNSDTEQNLQDENSKLLDPLHAKHNNKSELEPQVWKDDASSENEDDDKFFQKGSNPTYHEMFKQFYQLAGPAILTNILNMGTLLINALFAG